MATTYYMSGISLIVQYLTNIGVLAAGGFLYTYEGGTSTPVTTYTDSTGVTANANPMTLSGAARPASASGAPVAFWAPAGTLIRLVVTDALGNQLVYLDNVPGINDVSAQSNTLETLLETPISSSTGYTVGASLVAGGVMSFSNFAAMRVAGAPSLATNQTMMAVVQGAATNADGYAGLFYWNATSTSTDNGYTIIAPTGVSTGRWILVPLQASNLVPNVQKGNYTTQIFDGLGTMIYSDGSVADTWTIAANASVSYVVGTLLTFVNDSVDGANSMTIAINSDTLIWAATGATGSRTLAAGGMATALKVGATRWMINGGGLS
jgi:hypothetical protein